MTPPPETITVYISIGNSDDKLMQFQWAAFVQDVNAVLHNRARKTHGVWFSAPDSGFQNACWCVEVRPVMADDLKARLARTAKLYNQDSIAWAVAETEFVGPTRD